MSYCLQCRAVIVRVITKQYSNGCPVHFPLSPPSLSFQGQDDNQSSYCRLVAGKFGSYLVIAKRIKSWTVIPDKHKQAIKWRAYGWDSPGTRRFVYIMVVADILAPTGRVVSSTSSLWLETICQGYQSYRLNSSQDFRPVLRRTVWTVGWRRALSRRGASGLSGQKRLKCEVWCGLLIAPRKLPLTPHMNSRIY